MNSGHKKKTIFAYVSFFLCGRLLLLANEAKCTIAHSSQALFFDYYQRVCSWALPLPVRILTKNKAEENIITGFCGTTSLQSPNSLNPKNNTRNNQDPLLQLSLADIFATVPPAAQKLSVTENLERSFLLCLECSKDPLPIFVLKT